MNALTKLIWLVPSVIGLSGCSLGNLNQTGVYGVMPNGLHFIIEKDFKEQKIEEYFGRKGEGFGLASPIDKLKNNFLSFRLMEEEFIIIKYIGCDNVKPVYKDIEIEGVKRKLTGISIYFNHQDLKKCVRVFFLETKSSDQKKRSTYNITVIDEKYNLIAYIKNYGSRNYEEWISFEELNFYRFQVLLKGKVSFENELR